MHAHTCRAVAQARCTLAQARLTGELEIAAAACCTPFRKPLSVAAGLQSLCESHCCSSSHSTTVFSLCPSGWLATPQPAGSPGLLPCDCSTRLALKAGTLQLDNTACTPATVQRGMLIWYTQHAPRSLCIAPLHWGQSDSIATSRSSHCSTHRRAAVEPSRLTLGDVP